MTKKMMGVIYKAFKNGNLPDVSKEDIEKAYFYVNQLENEFKSYELKTYHLDVYECVKNLKNAVTAIFENDYQTANNIVKGFATV